MTAPTRDRLRALARRLEDVLPNDGLWQGEAEEVEQAAAALRAAADQLEAVRAWLDGQDGGEWDAVDLDALDRILDGGEND